MLFLDEPTTGVDPRSRAAIWSAVRSLAATGTTVLLTTQNLDEADRLADDVVIVEAGRTVASGSPDALKDTTGTSVVVAVEDAADLSAAAAVASRWATKPPAVDSEQLRLTVRIAIGSVTLPELVRHLDVAGVRAQDVSFRRPTLDEVFLDRTGDSARDEAEKEAVA